VVTQIQVPAGRTAVHPPVPHFLQAVMCHQDPPAEVVEDIEDNLFKLFYIALIFILISGMVG
jgi:hypothetical protein